MTETEKTINMGVDHLQECNLPYFFASLDLSLTEQQQVFCSDMTFDATLNPVVYGHSLGDQDYSYYQSIFDYVDLYNGNTRLFLYFSDDYLNNEEEKKQKRISTAEALFRLVNNYGESMDNKDHGHNLLHKLLLEGRIVFQHNNFAPLEVN